MAPLHRFATLFASLALLSAPARSLSNDWELVGTPGCSAGTVLCPQIGFDNDGVLHVAYQDGSVGGGRASVQRFVAGAWQYVGGPGTASAQQAWYNQFAFDAQNTIYLTHRDYGFGGRLSIRRFDTQVQGWLAVGPLAASPDEAHYTTIAIASDGTPYVAFADRSTTPIDRATAMRFVDGAWEPLGAPGFTTGLAGYPNVKLDDDDVPYVAFADGSHPDQFGQGKVSVMRYVEATDAWEFVGTPGFTTRGGLNVWLAFDKQQVPHIAYQQYHQIIVVMKFDGVQWVQVGGSASGLDHPTIETEGWRQWLSLVFDSQNTPYVAYQMLDNGHKGAVRKFNGTSWVPVGSLGFTPAAADYMVMAIDAFDVPWIAYRDTTVGLKLTLMRYAPSPYTYCTGVLSSAGCTPQIAATGTPSLTSTGAFTVSASQVINQRTGIVLFGTRPGHANFFGGTLCVKPPLMRAGIQNSGGSPEGVTDCTGALTFNFNALIQGGLYGTFLPDQMLYAQYWYRDQLNPLGPGLSNAVRFTIEP